MSRATSAASSRRLSRFAADLRAVRQAAGQPSYRRMAADAHYAAPALWRAASGNVVPSWNCVLAFLQACAITDLGAIHRWQRRWVALRQDPAAGRRPRPEASASVHDLEERAPDQEVAEPAVVRVALRMPAGLLRTGLRAVLALPTDMEVVYAGEWLERVTEALAGRGPKVMVFAPTRLTADEIAEARRFSQRAGCALVILVNHDDPASGLLDSLPATVVDRDSPIGAARMQEVVRQTAHGVFVTVGGHTLATRRWATPQPESVAVPEAERDARHYYRLTAREWQVLALLLEGLLDKQIARRLKISTHTANAHMRKLLRKTGLSNRTALIVLAAQRGWMRKDRLVPAAVESANSPGQPVTNRSLTGTPRAAASW